MATNISVITVKAAVEKVWDVLTKPELVKQWQYGSELTTDWEVAGTIRFRAEWEGNVFEQWGKVLEMTPLKLIKYSLFAPQPDLEDKPENYFVMSYLLTEKDGNVEIKIVQEDSRPGAVQEEQQGEENAVLTMLKSLVES